MSNSTRKFYQRLLSHRVHPVSCQDDPCPWKTVRGVVAAQAAIKAGGRRHLCDHAREILGLMYPLVKEWHRNKHANRWMIGNE